MSQSAPSRSSTIESKTDIDKNVLFGRYQAEEDRRIKLGMKMAHKALDIPDDDMNINVDKSVKHQGFGWKEMLVVVLGLLGTGGLGIGAYKALAPAPVNPPQTTTPITQPADHRDNIGLFEMDINGG